MITIQTTCQRCGCDFTPSAADIRNGTWRRCPPCRDGPVSKGISGQSTSVHTLSDDPMAPKFTPNYFKRTDRAKMNTRINVNVMDFGYGPGRVEHIRTELEKQRTAYRSLPAHSFEEDAIRRNVEDLEPLLASAEANEALRVKHAAARQADQDAKTEAHRAAAEMLIKSRLKRDYLALPGASEEAFEHAFPALLADHHRREMAKSGDALELAKSRMRF